MKKLITLIGMVLAVVIVANAQNSETRALGSFSEIKVSQSIRATLVSGNQNQAIVETSGVEVDDVITEVRGGTLYVEMDRGNYRSISVDVTITYQQLEALRVSSSARVTSEDVIKSEELSVKASSSGRVSLDIEVDKLKVEVSSSGSVELSGSATTQVVEASSSGRYSAYDVTSDGVKVDVSSSGKVEVNVRKEIFADASSSGRVNYKGDPEKVIADTSSSGKISKTN